MSADIARRAGALLLAVVLLVLVYYAWGAAASAPWLRATVAATVLLAVLRPRDALLVLAGLGPLIGTFGAAWDAPLPARDALVLACFTGWAIGLALRRQASPIVPSDLALPLIGIATVVLASAAVELWGQRQLLGPSQFTTRLRLAIEYGLLQERAPLKGLNAALVHLEGLAIFAAAVRASSGRPQFAFRIAAMAAAGAAGAAVLNVLRIVNAAVASPTPIQRMRELLTTIRVNVHFSDVNAAGSYFAMMFFPAAALSVRSDQWRRAAWAFAAAVIFAATWLTGSRAAVAGILAVVGFSLAARLRRGGVQRPVQLWTAAAGCALVALLFVALFPNKLFGSAVSTAVDIRLAMARITFRMLANEPVFGVGVGAYYESSGPLLLASPLASVYAHENAHNNVLQVLGELGLAGLTMFAWLLWRVARRLRATASADVMSWGILAGVVTLGLTALAGHPLLTPEVNHAFWLLLGAAAGQSQAGAVRSRRARRGLLLFTIAVMALLPWRLRTEVGTLDLEHVRYGTSEWISDADTRYQAFDRQATLFVSRDVGAVRIPLREPGLRAGELLDVRLEGRLVDRVRTSPEWRAVHILTPATIGNSNFRRIDLIVNTVPGVTRQVHVGRLELVQ